MAERPEPTGCTERPTAGTIWFERDGMYWAEPTGCPAITPRVQLSDAEALTTPAFTAEDALAHVASHISGSLVPPTVVGAQFMTDAQFVARFKTEPGLAPDKLLCVVEVHGRFRIPSVPPGAPPSVFHVFYDVVNVVFNARTGNHLMLNFRASAVEPES
jgi:hypothetical protein